MGLREILENRKNVLGMNERNLKYVREYNKAKYKRYADDKILTKNLLTQYDIPTPKLIASISSIGKFEDFDWNILPKSFVIKPVRGSEGAGIDIFYNQDKNGKWIRADKTKATIEDIKKLAYDILDGRFTPYSEPDAVLIEERIKSHKAFKYYSYKGTPDVRVIIFNKIPVMAYLRLPTKESGGKANMAMGAIGAGIDIANGRTTSAVYGKSNGGKGKIIEMIPGTKLRISGLKIPYWNGILETAIRCQSVSKLGFLAVDFLIDREEGPKVVELTARPGLSIQLANNRGLRWRLRKVKGLKPKSVEHSIRIAKDLFGGEIEESIEKISGKELIGIYESVRLYGVNSEEAETKAKIDTGADSTSIDKNLASKLGYKELIEDFNNLKIEGDPTSKENKKLLDKHKVEFLNKYSYFRDIDIIKSSHGISIRPKIEIKLKLGDLIFDTFANIYDREKMSYKVIVGRKSLGKFLIEP